MTLLNQCEKEQYIFQNLTVDFFKMSFCLWFTPHLLSLLQIYLNFSSRLPVAPGPHEESSSSVQRLNSVGSHSTATQPLLSNNDVFLEGTGPHHPPV